ncbi:MAG: hypothetical protein WHS82_00835 [Candidatus Methanosuratincola sp.]
MRRVVLLGPFTGEGRGEADNLLLMGLRGRSCTKPTHVQVSLLDVK